MKYTEDLEAIIDEAIDLYECHNIVFDSAPQPKVSFAAEGAWVRAWVLVPWDTDMQTIQCASRKVADDEYLMAG